tara:strand:- start:267 stop:479 length:213 start_codon:yes stop_codon:yes gene_type:complete
MTSSTGLPPQEDDWFDIDKYKQAAGVAYSFSKKKLEDEGKENRKTIGYESQQKRREEERDYKQAQSAYKY